MACIAIPNGSFPPGEAVAEADVRPRLDRELTVETVPGRA